MKVYVFIANGVIDDEILDTYIQVFDSLEKAQATFKKWVDGDKGERKYAKKNGWEIGDDYPDHFCAYKFGYYESNHTELAIHECRVE